jgi:hypothetical protein
MMACCTAQCGSLARARSMIWMPSSITVIASCMRERFSRTGIAWLRHLDQSR